MRINGKVEEMIKLWNQHCLNISIDSKSPRLESNFSEQNLRLRNVYKNKELVNLKQKIQKKNIVKVNKEHKEETLINSLPTEIVLNLIVRHKCLGVFNMMKNTQYRSFIDSHLIDEILLDVNNLDLISVLRTLRWLCEKSGETIWKNERRLDLSRLPIFPFEIKSASRSQICAQQKEDKDPVREIFKNKIENLSKTINPIIKRRLMLFILHHGPINEFLVQKFFKFSGNIFEIAQKNISKF